MMSLRSTTAIRAGLGDRVKAVGTVLVLIAGAAACGFRPSGGLGDDPDAAAVTTDAGAIDDAGVTDATAADAAAAADARVDAMGPITPAFCDPDDATLRACFAFTGGSVTSGAGASLTVSETGTMATPGAVGSGLGLGAASVVKIAEVAALDLVGPMTFETFVRVDATPVVRAGLYDDNGEWGVFIDDQRRPYCAIGILVTGPPLVLATWTHLACVYDRVNVTMYIDGVPLPPIARAAELATSGIDGSNIGQDCRTGGTSGDPLTGGMDELRVWSVARSRAQIAAAAARATP